MPRCRICNNTQSFGSSRVPVPAKAANGPISALIGEFDATDAVTRITSLGADKYTINDALAHPTQYFDLASNAVAASLSGMTLPKLTVKGMD